MVKLHYKNYLLMILILVGVVTNFERFIFSLVLEPIKQDLDLNDSQLGLMTGVAFFFFYAIAGVPIARWADRGNRNLITSIAVAVSGLMVSLCGLASSFYQLITVRACIAVGEASAVPIAQSLIADYFDRTERPRAMAIFVSFYTISMIIGYLMGGWLVELYGWRNTFIIIGIPALFVAALVKFTLREPRLKEFKTYQSNAPSLGKAFKSLWGQRSFRLILVLFSLSYFFTAGVNQWLPTFLIRSHDMSTSEVGNGLALSFGVFATLGLFLGGYLATQHAARKEKLQMRILALVTLGYGIANAAAYLAPVREIALVFIAVGAFLLALTNGPVLAAIQSMVSERMRSFAMAVVLLFGNLVGYGLGPLVLGAVSDLLSEYFGQDSLRYALLIFCPGTLLIAYFYWKLSNHIEDDIETIESVEENLAKQECTKALGLT